MDLSKSFTMQIAHICIELCGCNNEDSACLNSLKQLFAQHEVSGDTKAAHRVVVCDSKRLKIPRDAKLQWVSTFIGVGGPTRRRRWFSFRKKKSPLYSGTGEVKCFKDETRQVYYFVPANAGWRIEHDVNNHVTHVYSNKQNDLSDGLPSMLLHVIGSQYGCYLMYASCISLNGESVLFTGNSGEGKTTLCIELTKKGAAYIGDDQVLVYLKDGQPMIGALLFPVKCYADSEHTHKKRIDLLSDKSQRPPLTVPLKSVCLIKREKSANTLPHIEPMHGEEMFSRMLKLTNKTNTNFDGHDFVNTLSCICGTAKCYTFVYSDCGDVEPSLFFTND